MTPALTEKVFEIEVPSRRNTSSVGLEMDCGETTQRVILTPNALMRVEVPGDGRLPKWPQHCLDFIPEPMLSEVVTEILTAQREKHLFLAEYRHVHPKITGCHATLGITIDLREDGKFLHPTEAEWAPHIHLGCLYIEGKDLKNFLKWLNAHWGLK